MKQRGEKRREQRSVCYVTGLERVTRGREELQAEDTERIEGLGQKCSCERLMERERMEARGEAPAPFFGCLAEIKMEMELIDLNFEFQNMVNGSWKGGGFELW